MCDAAKNDFKLFHDNLASRGKIVEFPESYWDDISKITKFLKVFKNASTVLSGTYYPTSHLVLQNIIFMSSAIDDFSIKSNMFIELTTVDKFKLQKYLMELQAVFTCTAALNPRVNVIGVDTLIDEINVNLRLYEDNLE